MKQSAFKGAIRALGRQWRGELMEGYSGIDNRPRSYCSLNGCWLKLSIRGTVPWLYLHLGGILLIPW